MSATLFLPKLFTTGALIFGLSVSGQAALMVVDSLGGANDDAAASGRLVDGGDLGTWTLTTTVSGTGYTNSEVSGGIPAVEYRMNNSNAGSTDTNLINFAVAVGAGVYQGITLRQSSYDSGAGLNGAASPGTEFSQMTVNWSGGGSATVDAGTGIQITDASGAALPGSITSGQIVRFARGANADDDWSIALPSTVTALSVLWGPNGVPTEALGDEWISFDVDIAPVPEPAPPLMGALGASILLLSRRRIC